MSFSDCLNKLMGCRLPGLVYGLASDELADPRFQTATIPHATGAIPCVGTVFGRM